MNQHARSRIKKILVLDPPATFGHGAGIEYAKRNAIRGEFIFCKTNLAICQALANGAADLAIIPLENNIAGLVPDWLLWAKSELQFGTPQTKIIGESVVPISQRLMVKKGSGNDKDSILAVLSHERALKQCGRLIASLLAKNPDFKVMETTSTAEAARIVSESRPGDRIAAIAGSTASTLYDVDIIEENVEDNPGNITRFGILQNARNETPSDIKKTELKPFLQRVIIVFDVLHEVGALNKITGKLLELGANVTSLGVLPQGMAKRYSYSFYLEYEIDCTRAGNSIQALRTATSHLVLLGSFSVKNT